MYGGLFIIIFLNLTVYHCRSCLSCCSTGTDGCFDFSLGAQASDVACHVERVQQTLEKTLNPFQNMAISAGTISYLQNEIHCRILWFVACI
jgi:hypothetical protein